MSPRHQTATARDLRQLLGARPSPRISMEELATLRSFPSAEAARKFVNRRGLGHKRGRRVLVDLREFDRACEREAGRGA